MKQKMKQWIAYILSFCMIFSMTQFVSGSAVYAAEVADGAIDETREGDRIIRTVRYLTDTETTSTSELYLESHADRLTDFIAGTESMKWSVEFKTSATGLQALLFLERSDQYCAFYLSGGSLYFEPQKGNIAVSASVSYADNQYHTAELEIQKGKAVILKMDDQELARNTSPTMLADFSWEPTAFTIGGSKDYSKASGWKFTGSMRNVVLERSSIVPKESVWHGANFPDTPISVEEGSDLEDKSLSMSYRLKEESGDKTTLMTFGDDGEIYADPASGKVGVKIGETTVEKEVQTALGTIKWHNVALAKSGSNLELFVDGSSAGSGEYSGDLDFSTLQKGEDVYCSWAEIYNGAIGEDQAAELHQSTDLTIYPDPTEKLEGYYKGPNRDIFNAGFDGSVAYRIPAITTSRKTGTVVAAIDKRWYTSADTGVNDTVIRRSEDNGKTWGPVIPVIDMPDDDAYTIDPEIVTDNDPESPHYGRIYILVDLNAYGTSLWGAVAGTGYTAIDGKQYQILNDADGNTYTIREDGIVYDDDGNVTEYRVETEAEAPYREQGALYKNGEKIGSIYKNAELAMVDTVYMMMTYSDDDGKTWSRPKDITPEIKADWMSFFGVGPGAGVQLQHDEAHKGRLVFTMYCMRKPNANAHFSSYNVYSDDHGKTWHRGGSPNPDPETSTRELNESCIVELNNGHLIQFMKNATAEVAMAVSADGGATWDNFTHAQGIPEIYCEMAVLHYGNLYDPADEQTKEAIIFANPSGPGRDHGKVRIAFVNDDDTLDWAYEKMIEEHRFLYNSLTLMNDGNIGMIYENEKGSSTSAAFTSFSPQYIMDSNVYENTPQPSQISVNILDASGNETETLRIGSEIRVNITFDNIVFASGNVTSNIRVGDDVKEAQLIGNKDNNTLVFSYTVQPEDTGTIEALAEINVKENGVAETVYNVPLVDKPFVTKTILVGQAQAEGFAQLPTTGMTATAGSQHSATGNEGPASNVLNDSRNQIWHTRYDDDNAPEGRSKHYVTINLGATYLVSGLKYLPRSGSNNGTITKYQVEVSTDGENFYPYARGEWAKNGNEKLASFAYGPVPATHVRLRALDTGDKWATAAAIRIIGSSQTEGAADRAALVQNLVKYGEYAERLSDIYPTLAQALEDAEAIALDASATQEQINSALTVLTEAVASSLQGLDNDLADALASAEKKNQSDYTVTTWSAYQAAINTVQALADDASQEEKLAAYAAFKNAEAKLRLTDKVEAETKADAETKAGEAIGKLEAIVQEDGSISTDAEFALPTETEDGTALNWSTDSEEVTIGEDGKIQVSKDLKEEKEVTLTTMIFYGNGKSIIKSLTVKIKPLPEYTVTFNADGGTPVPENQTIISGEQATEPANPSKTGYTFAGWYQGSAAAKYDFKTSVTGNIELKAKWTANTYKVTFDPNGTGVSGMPGTMTKAYNETLTLSTPTVKAPARSGYKFLGWSETKSGQVIPSLKVTAIVTLYAKWEEIPKESPALTKGMTETVSNMKYKVLDPDKNTVAIVGSTNKSAKNLTIKDTVKIKGISCNIVQIGKNAFKNYKKLTKVTIGKNVATIETNAFMGCKNLKTIMLKGKIMVKVKSKAFKNTAKNLTVKASKVKKSQRKKLQTAMRKTGGNKKLTVK